MLARPESLPPDMPRLDREVMAGHNRAVVGNIFSSTTRAFEKAALTLPQRVDRPNGGNDIVCLRHGEPQYIRTGFDDGLEHIHQTYILAAGVVKTGYYHAVMAMQHRVGAIFERGCVVESYHEISFSSRDLHRSIEGRFDNPGQAVHEAVATLKDYYNDLFRRRPGGLLTDEKGLGAVAQALIVEAEDIMLQDPPADMTRMGSRSLFRRIFG